MKGNELEHTQIINDSSNNTSIIRVEGRSEQKPKFYEKDL